MYWFDNLMLCPMELYPFYGPYHHIIAVAHQAILCPLTCKVFCAVSSLFSTPYEDEAVMWTGPTERSW